MLLLLQPMHDAHNSWSDTGRVQGPTGRRCTKGGVSGPAEDLRPVSEVEAGVSLRPASQSRGQVVVQSPERRPGPGTRRVRGGVVTPSIHPEVPGTRFVSPGPGQGIRQSMGWRMVCGTATSGIWVLKGDATARYLSILTTFGCNGGNGDHTRPPWSRQGTTLHVPRFFSPRCSRSEVPSGVNLNRYASSGSCILWHSDNESLFVPQSA